jgi:hypothetical protein
MKVQDMFYWIDLFYHKVKDAQIDLLEGKEIEGYSKLDQAIFEFGPIYHLMNSVLDSEALLKGTCNDTTDIHEDQISMTRVEPCIARYSVDNAKAKHE